MTVESSHPTPNPSTLTHIPNSSAGYIIPFPPLTPARTRTHTRGLICVSVKWCRLAAQIEHHWFFSEWGHQCGQHNLGRDWVQPGALCNSKAKYDQDRRKARMWAACAGAYVRDFAFVRFSCHGCGKTSLIAIFECIWPNTKSIQIDKRGEKKWHWLHTLMVITDEVWVNKGHKRRLLSKLSCYRASKNIIETVNKNPKRGVSTFHTACAIVTRIQKKEARCRKVNLALKL